MSEKKAVDIMATVCKHCTPRAAYASGNTLNMMLHLHRHHANVSVDSARTSDSGKKE